MDGRCKSLSTAVQSCIFKCCSIHHLLRSFDGVVDDHAPPDQSGHTKVINVYAVPFGLSDSVKELFFMPWGVFCKVDSLPTACTLQTTTPSADGRVSSSAEEGK